MAEPVFFSAVTMVAAPGGGMPDLHQPESCTLP